MILFWASMLVTDSRGGKTDKEADKENAHKDKNLIASAAKPSATRAVNPKQ
jgi:hypothetical protein